MSIQGKYFIVVSKLSGFVLDVKGTGAPVAGSSVVVAKKTGGNNQQWFVDPVNNTIRNRGNPSLCLTSNTQNLLTVANFDAANTNQTWVYNGTRNTIDNKKDTTKVLDIVGCSTSEGAEIRSYAFHGCKGQLWTRESQPKVYFFIHDQLDGKVMDVYLGLPTAGAKIVAHNQHYDNSTNQLWFEDIDGNLRSKLAENVVLDAATAADGTLVLGGDNVVKSRTYWSIQGDFIVNVFNPNEVLDVLLCSTANAATIVAHALNGGNNQKWTLEFV